MADEGPKKRASRQRLLTLSSEEGERHASWLELFFDLVFVLAVAKVAAILVNESNLHGFLKFTALFVPVWWAWVGYTFYADRFESERIAFRVMLFAAMLAVAAWSLSLGGAFTEAGDAAFVGTYSVVLGILTVLYISTSVHVPIARALAAQFIIAFSVSIVFLLASLLVAPPIRYWFWLAAVVSALASPFINLRQTRIIPFDLAHIPERFGLFTIIVLGEAVIATANGAADSPWNFTTGAVATLGFAMAACIWWINFEFVEDDALKSPSLVRRFIYLYCHFFTVASIVAIGIGVEHAIKEAAEDHLHLATLLLLGGGIATFIAAVTVVKLASGVCRLLFARGAAIAAALAVAALGPLLPPIPAVGAFLFILAIAAWFESRFGEERPVTEHAAMSFCAHSGEAIVFEPRSAQGCEECVRNNYKWVHLRMCLTCGHVGCCDSSVYKHATKHFHTENHPLMASIEENESWAWCYVDDRFVPLASRIGEVDG